MINVDRFVELGIWVTGIAMSGIGIEMTINPPTPERRTLKWAYRATFIILGVAFVGFNVWQSNRADEARKEAEHQHQIEQQQHEQEQIRNEGNIKYVQGQLDAMTKVLNGVEKNSNPQQLLPALKAAMPTSLQAPAAPQSPKITAQLMSATSGDKPPYETKFLVLTNQIITPVRLLVQCQQEIISAGGSVMGTGAAMAGGWGGRFSPNQYGIGILAPAWAPGSPLVVTVHSNSKDLTCQFAEQ